MGPAGGLDIGQDGEDLRHGVRVELKLRLGARLGADQVALIGAPEHAQDVLVELFRLAHPAGGAYGVSVALAIVAGGLEGA
ncbi:hypothetical protein D3C72_1848630 [compost metagenome]